ncbi:MAG: DUF488 domain-containing protein [Motiliproteus sp.]
MNIYTIGFTRKSAAVFFEFIKSSNISMLLDVRLNNVSQLSGFAKKDDLRFFLQEICGTEYLHVPELAPTKDILNAYKKGDIPWREYEDKFMNLMSQRNVERMVNPYLVDGSCLLCSEHEPHLCHRRLVVDYINENTQLDLKVKHLY